MSILPLPREESLDIKSQVQAQYKNLVNWIVRLVYWGQNLKDNIEKAVNSMRNLFTVIDIMTSQPKLLRALWFHCQGRGWSGASLLLE